MDFLDYLSSVLNISEALKQELNAIAEKKKAAKNEVIVNAGERCAHLCFVEKGLLRGYYTESGKEITNWFAQEGEFATSFYSFVSKEPSFETIQALEPCELIRIPHASLQQLYVKFPETERLGRVIMETYYVKLEERLLSIQFKGAKERYQHFFATRPSLLQRSSLGQIASYLGMSQETLSRIRAEI